MINVGQETKLKIRNAAVQVISKKGFYNTRMSDIAEEAELAVGTLYNYFKSKDEILEYIFKKEMERRMEIMAELREKDISTKKFLKEFLDRHFEVLIRNPHLGRVVVREKDFSGREKSGNIQKFIETLIKALENIFVEAIENSEIKDLDPHLMAVFFFGAIHGIIEHALTKPEIMMLKDAPEFIMARIEHIFIK
ncbi:TetR/AcrR family transcriptional regulator [Halanaerobium hydrogeniformans]|uniref:TetR/AcrR family transcriptional regulator n=1 Tax=Halanaerobium hydrogeniformans TaxID=656519 RepID=UPI00135CC9DD